MDGNQYLSFLNKKYAGIDRGSAENALGGGGYDGIYEPIKLSPDNILKSKFKSTFKKTNKFFRKMRITFGIKAKIK